MHIYVFNNEFSTRPRYGDIYSKWCNSETAACEKIRRWKAY